MIYTVTLNPALDRTLWIEEIRYDESNRIMNELNYAGGKGIDVSRVLNTLEVTNQALGFVGGFAGEELEGRLVNEGIQCDFTRISRETRTNIIINNKSKKSQTAFNAKGPEVKPYELMQFIHKMENLRNPEIVAVSGSLPPGAHPEIYRKIIEIAKHNGADVVLDTYGEALKKGIEAYPMIIKPNIHELSQLHGSKLKKLEEIVKAANNIHKQGVEIVLVSLGAKGILLVTEKSTLLASPPDVDAVNTIGAGDSAVAGFIYGLTKNKSLMECLTFAVAAGTATTLRPATAMCRKKDFKDLVSRVTVKEM